MARNFRPHDSTNFQFGGNHSAVGIKLKIDLTGISLKLRFRFFRYDESKPVFIVGDPCSGPRRD